MNFSEINGPEQMKTFPRLRAFNQEPAALGPDSKSSITQVLKECIDLVWQELHNANIMDDIHNHKLIHFSQKVYAELNILVVLVFASNE
jgi:hypothetical protein